MSGLLAILLAVQAQTELRAGPSTELRAGFGAADLTPPPGASIPGGFRPNPSKGVRDPLWAVACVVTDGTTPVALVGIDALFVGKHTVRSAREEIEKTTRIPGANVLVNASHTHAGGPILSCLGNEGDPVYEEQVARGIAKAVEIAWKALVPCEVGIGRGREDSISFNRRFLMKDGREITHPGKPGSKYHDQIVRPAGPIDPEVGVLAARKPGGAVFGIVVNFACHCTVVGGNQFSADYPAFLRKHLKARYGEETPVVFLNGPSGDVTQVDNLSTAREFGPEHAEMMGAKLAAEAVRTINRAPWMKSLSTAVATEAVVCRIRPEPDAAAEKPPFGLGSGPDDVYAEERRKVAEERARTPEIACEVQAIRIGPLGIATNGAEYFCEYGLRIKQASPHPFTWVSALSNEYIGYVPTAQAFVGGGYEPRTARSSKLAPDAGQRLLEGALRALGRVAAKEDPVVLREFIYEKAPFPSCHASTIVETKEGLVAAWFGGTDEGRPDVGIWLSRHDGKAWSDPVEVANGLQEDGKRHPTWNPVLFQPAGGPLYLYYKDGPSPSRWWGMRMTSTDGGRSWSRRERLPEGILGPIRNQPVQLADGTVLSPSSTETPGEGWRAHLEVSRDGGKSWAKVGPLNDDRKVELIQPAILTWPGGKLQLLMRNRNRGEIRGVVVESWSADGGKSWSEPRGTDLPNPNSGIDAVMLRDGRGLLVYNHTPRGRTPLNVALSADGKSWKSVLTLESDPGEYSYPFVIQTSDGKVHVTYTWKRQKVRHVVLDPSKL
jgi:predicted neuraminidase